MHAILTLATEEEEEEEENFLEEVKYDFVQKAAEKKKSSLSCVPLICTCGCVWSSSLSLSGIFAS